MYQIPNVSFSNLHYKPAGFLNLMTDSVSEVKLGMYSILELTHHSELLVKDGKSERRR